MENKNHIKQLTRKAKAAWRDSILLLREFRNPLVFLVLAVIIMGWLYYQCGLYFHEPVDSISEAIYLVLTLIFFQASGDFPHSWVLQIFFFLMPLVGVVTIAQGLANFGVMFFNRRARGKEWEMALASTMNNHIVLVGLGHLGYRVAKHLHDIDKEVVIIELQPKTDLIEGVRSLGIPVLEDDATRECVLKSANIQKAHSILLCTQNDSLNLQIAVKARNLNPNIDVIIRIFDDDFANSLAKQFGFKALSATGMAAPVFAASAADVDITPPITIEGQPNSLARLKISQKSRLSGYSVHEIEDKFDLSVVLLNHAGKSDVHPSSTASVISGDTIAVLGSPDQVKKLVQHNQ